MAKFKIGDRVHVISTLPQYQQWISKTLTITKTDSWGEYNYEVKENDLSWKDEELELITEGGAPVARKTYKLKKDTPTVRKGAILQEACDDGTQEYVLITETNFKDSEAPRGAEWKVFDRSLVEEQPTWFEEVFAVEPQYMTREELDQWEAFKGRKKAQPAKPAIKRKGAYKVGDVVRLRDDLKVDFAYGGALWNEEMVKFAGQSVKIKRIISKGFYKIEDDESNWLFTDSMIVGQTDVRKKRTWTEEQRAAHGAKIKAAHRRKKAATKRAA